MEGLSSSSEEYLKKIQKRAKKSRISKSYQFTGLEVAKMLGDWKYKGLHIKLAKDLGETKLRMLAKAIAEEKSIKYKGAYLMKLLFPKEKGK